jgi:putative transposase
VTVSETRMGQPRYTEFMTLPDRMAALQFLKRAMKRFGQPRVIVTDRLRSYRAAKNVIGNAADQEYGR